MMTLSTPFALAATSSVAAFGFTEDFSREATRKPFGLVEE
jgi:hypothetical protein